MKKRKRMKSLPPSLDLLLKTEKDKEAYSKWYHARSAKETRELVVKLLEKMKAQSETETMKKTKYEQPCWPHYQADHIGYKRALTEVIKLLTKE